MEDSIHIAAEQASPVIGQASAECNSPPTGVSFADIGPHQCRWILSRDGEPTMFCGEATVHDKSSWCPAHHARVFTKVQR